MEPLATAYLVPAQTISYPGAPGARLDFRAGACRIVDQRLIVHALRRADVTLTPTDRYVSHVPAWVAACGEHQPARAKVALPDGTLLHPPDYLPPEL